MTGCKIAQNHCSKLSLIRDFGSPVAFENLIGEVLNMTSKKVGLTSNYYIVFVDIVNILDITYK